MTSKLKYYDLTSVNDSIILMQLVVKIQYIKYNFLHAYYLGSAEIDYQIFTDCFYRSLINGQRDFVCSLSNGII